MRMDEDLARPSHVTQAQAKLGSAVTGAIQQSSSAVTLVTTACEASAAGHGVGRCTELPMLVLPPAISVEHMGLAACRLISFMNRATPACASVPPRCSGRSSAPGQYEQL